jgi:hypothetical protein
VKLDWAVLSSAAEGREGIAYILGAGWDTSVRDDYPTPFVGAVVIRLLFGADEVGEHHLKLRISHANGSILGESITVPFVVDIPESLPSGWDASSLITVTLSGLPIPEPGTYSIAVDVDEISLKMLPFRFVQPSDRSAASA